MTATGSGLTQRQITVGDVIGSYMMSVVSGTMAAGLAANSPIVSWRWGGGNPSAALVKKIVIDADNAGTAFAAGTAEFDLFVARGFSASDTGGTAATITGNNGKLRTQFPTTLLADFRAAGTATLTAGTRTLDATPLNRLIAGIPVTTVSYEIINPYTPIFDARVSEQPLICANNEGFVIQASVPATGTWSFSCAVYWDEVLAYP